MEKGSCNGKTLSLTAGEIASLLLKHRIQSVLVFQKFQKTHFLKRIFHLGIGRIRISHPEIVSDRSFKEITVVADQGDGMHQILLTDFGYRNSVDPDPAAEVPDLPGQKSGGSTFSTAGNTDKGDKAACRNGQGNIL